MNESIFDSIYIQPANTTDSNKYKIINNSLSFLFFLVRFQFQFACPTSLAATMLHTMHNTQDHCDLRLVNKSDRFMYKQHTVYVV